MKKDCITLDRVISLVKDTYKELHQPLIIRLDCHYFCNYYLLLEEKDIDLFCKDLDNVNTGIHNLSITTATPHIYYYMTKNPILGFIEKYLKRRKEKDTPCLLVRHLSEEDTCLYHFCTEDFFPLLDDVYGGKIIVFIEEPKNYVIHI